MSDSPAKSNGKSKKLARDGTRRGGARVGAGRKPLPENLFKRQQLEANREAAQALAAMHAKDALKVLIFEMKNGELSADRVRAANSILDRALGKPVALVQGDHNHTHDFAGARDELASTLIRLANRSELDERPTTLQ